MQFHQNVNYNNTVVYEFRYLTLYLKRSFNYTISLL